MKVQTIDGTEYYCDRITRNGEHINLYCYHYDKNEYVIIASIRKVNIWKIEIA